MSQSLVENFAKLIAKYDNKIPRYTSYPTAPHFSDKINGELYKSWLERIDENEELSLYFHIPFCHEMCWYCGCHTKISKRYAPIENYLHILLREISMIGDVLKKRHKVSHIHFGGGSPTILVPADFDLLMQKIRENFVVKDDAQIAIEVDPRSVNQEKVLSYQKNGVNRISIGVQDFDADVQAAINRIQPFEVVYDAVKLFQNAKINNINLDLVYGLPKQDLEKIRKNIYYSLLLKPTRIALFSYAHVPWMKKHMRLIKDEDLPNNFDKTAFYMMSKNMLQQNGYTAIGLDHFAKNDDSLNAAFTQQKLKRNFQGYSCDKSSIIIGFGASSISHLHQGYAQNIADFMQYEKAILNGQIPVVKGVEVRAQDIMRKEIIDNLMCYMQLNLDEILQKYNLEKNFFTPEISKLENLIKDGLVIFENNIIKINPETPQIARVVSSLFDEFFSAENNTKHSKIA